MQTVLLLDTNLASLPIYEALELEGYIVYVAGSNPQDYLAKIVEHYLEVDYADTEKVKQLINTLGIDFLVPGCNDLSYKICASINVENKFYGIDSLELTDLINEKQQFRAFANQIGIPVPIVFTPDNFDGSSSVIVKPIDAYSGRGVTVVPEYQPQLFADAILYASAFSRSKKYIVEEYIEGQLYSHSAFISDHEILVDFIVEEHGSASAFAVDTSRLVHDFDEEILANIRTHICNMAKHLKLNDGLIHSQFIKRNNDIWFIEITRRCPGDLYSKLIEMSTGFSYGAAYVQPFLNKKIIATYLPKQHHIMRHTISLDCEQIFSSLSFKISLQIEAYFSLSKSGDIVKESPFGRIGLLFVKAKSHEELFKIIEFTVKRELYKIV